MANKSNRETAQQTFRQFAWNLAGTLQAGKGNQKPASARPSGKR